MSINDPITLEYDDREGRDWYYLSRGRETFYNDDRYMRVWEHPEDAIIWCEEQMNCTPEISPNPTSKRGR